MLRKQAIGDIGWSIGQEKGALSAVAQSRLMALLDHRWKALKDASRDEGSELESFGWWVSCEAFPESWIVKRAMEILEKQHSLSPDFAVAEAFASLSARYRLQACGLSRPFTRSY